FCGACASAPDVSTALSRASGLRATGLTHNLANSLRQLGLPQSIRRWNLTTSREKLVKSGANVGRHAKHVIFQLAEAVPGHLFVALLERIGRLQSGGSLRVRFAVNDKSV